MGSRWRKIYKGVVDEGDVEEWVHDGEAPRSCKIESFQTVDGTASVSSSSTVTDVVLRLVYSHNPRTQKVIRCPAEYADT